MQYKPDQNNYTRELNQEKDNVNKNEWQRKTE